MIDYESLILDQQEIDTHPDLEPVADWRDHHESYEAGMAYAVEQARISGLSWSERDRERKSS